jgi:hypothetical protein
MTTEHFSSEQKILRVMRKVLGSVVKDVTPRDGLDNPLTDNTIEEIRDIFGLISVREKELLETLGQISADRPHYPGDKPAAKIIPISVGSLKASKKPAESTNPLAQTALFKGVDLDAVEPLLDDCPLYELKVGETLLAAGEKNNHLFLVMAGSLKAELDSARTMNFAAGQCIGEISALGESTMSAPVVAVEESLLLAIDPDTLWAMIAADAVVARNILAMLAHR